MRRTIGTALIAMTLTTGVALTPAMGAGIYDAGFVADTGAADRIEAGERLRTLTQALGSAACHLQAGVDTDASARILTEGQAEFERLMTALEQGDTDLHILEAETHPRVLRLLAALRDEWNVVRPAYDQIKSTSDDAALATVFTETNKMLTVADKLVAELEGQYTNPTELLQSDMLLIEVAGKQAMASQRLSFEACRVWSGHGTDKDRDELRQYSAQFEFAVKALLDGAPQLGIAPAPNAMIQKSLSQAISNWDEVRWKLENLSAESEISTDEATKLCRVLYGKMAKMQKIAHMYVEHSRRIYQ